MKVTIKGMTFYCAYASAVNNAKVFTVRHGRDSETHNRSAEYIKQYIHLFQHQMIDDLWTIMYENDADALIVWKLTYAM